MTIISFKVRFSTGETSEVKDIDTETTVGEVKKILHEQNIAGVEPARQRLIFRGRILNDEQTLENAGIQDGHTIHLVKSSTAKPSGSPAASTPSTAPSSVPSNVPGTAPMPNPFASAAPAPSMFGDPFAGFGGLPGMPGMPGMGGMPQPTPEMLRQMMENPMVQRMMEDPEMIRAMIQQNPMMRAMIEQNPQLEQVLSDPQIMRQAMQAATNPSMMQELLRSQDRALANIESLPGGHNALRRMYEQDIDPMVRAAEETTERLYEQQQQQRTQQQSQQSQTAPSAGPAASPMPNPWSSPAQQQQQTRPSPAFNPWGSFNPAGASAPGTGGGNPYAAMTAMMQDPDYMRRLMEPANMQAIMQLQQAIQQLQRGGILPEGALPGMPPFMSGGGGGMGFPGFPGFPAPSPFGATQPSATPMAPAAPIQPPEVRFASQLSQLESMGFTDRESNIRALTATNGNVNAALERLLQ